MSKKKLLLVAPSLKQGGFQRVCARTALLLSEHFEVSIALFDNSDIAYPLENILIYDIGVKAQAGTLNKILNVLKRIRKVKALKKQQQIDISYSFGMSANLINSLTKVNDTIWCGIRSYIDLDTKSLGLVCKKSDWVVCCSKVLEEYIHNRYPKTKMVTIYNPFDVEKLIEESKEPIDEKDRSFFENGKKIIAAMGREDVLKGYWHLIKSFSKLEQPDVALCIIGNGTFEKEKKLVKELGIEDRVYFTGGKTNPFAYLKYANVYVMSSIHEGFPNALVEAMALDIPVISTNCETGPAEILSESFEKVKDSKGMELAEYGILVPRLKEEPDYEVSEPDAEEMVLTRAIEKMLQDAGLREDYRNRAKERVKEFSTLRYINAFQELAQRI